MFIDRENVLPELAVEHPEPFAEFLARTAAARPEEYAEAIRAAAEHWGLSAAQVAAEFERMKAHILHYYEGVVPVSSFLDSPNRPVDCVPFEQQPTVRAARAAGYAVDATPPRPTPAASSSAAPPSAAPHPHRSRCPPGTIPLLRITLERMIALGTFDNFFRKMPPPPAAEPPTSGGSDDRHA